MNRDRPGKLRAMRIPMRRVAAAAFPLFLSAQSAPVGGGAAELITRGDARYAARAENARKDVADPKPVTEAVAAYQAAVAANGASVEARWKYLRAVYFLAVYCGKDEAARKQLLGDARAVGEAGIAALEAPLTGKARAERIAELKKNPAAAELYFWSAVVWGEWSLAYGKLAAVRKGAAAKIRDFSQTTIDLDPALEEGGGWRVLGRLHHQSPMVVLFTGWVKHKEAPGMLRKALAAGPGNPINQFFLAEAILDHDERAKPEADELLKRCAQAPPRPAFPVEDARYGRLCRDRRASGK